jgi:hypothetical protein
MAKYEAKIVIELSRVIGRSGSGPKTRVQAQAGAIGDLTPDKWSGPSRRTELLPILGAGSGREALHRDAVGPDGKGDTD